MKLTSYIVALFLIGSLSAKADLRIITDAEKDGIKAAVKEQLVDPSSAQFEWYRDVNFGTPKSYYCAKVNAKSIDGKYSGFSFFVISINRDAEGKIVGPFGEPMIGTEAGLFVPVPKPHISGIAKICKNYVN